MGRLRGSTKGDAAESGAGACGQTLSVHELSLSSAAGGVRHPTDMDRRPEIRGASLRRPAPCLHDRRPLQACDLALPQAGRLDLKDFMPCEITPDTGHPQIQNDGMRYEGLRFRTDCRLAGKLFGQRFGVGVASMAHSRHTQSELTRSWHCRKDGHSWAGPRSTPTPPVPPPSKAA